MLTSSDSVNAAVWEMVEAGGRTAETFGVGRLLGQIYILLYLKNKPISLIDIASELNVSKASVSIACRQLATFGALQRVTRRGNRQDFYRVVQDFKSLLQHGLLPVVEKKLDSASMQIERSRSLLGDSEGEDSRLLLDRLDEAGTRIRKIRDLIANPIVRRLL